MTRLLRISNVMRSVFFCPSLSLSRAARSSVREIYLRVEGTAPLPVCKCMIAGGVIPRSAVISAQTIRKKTKCNAKCREKAGGRAKSTPFRRSGPAPTAGTRFDGLILASQPSAPEARRGGPIFAKERPTHAYSLILRAERAYLKLGLMVRPTFPQCPGFPSQERNGGVDEGGGGGKMPLTAQPSTTPKRFRGQEGYQYT